MLKSPEEYLSSLSFDPPEPRDHSLTYGERIFVEKYLGMEALELLPELAPESLQVSPPVKTLEPQKQIEVAPDISHELPEVLESTEIAVQEKVQEPLEIGPEEKPLLQKVEPSAPPSVSLVMEEGPKEKDSQKILVVAEDVLEKKAEEPEKPLAQIAPIQAETEKPSDTRQAVESSAKIIPAIREQSPESPAPQQEAVATPEKTIARTTQTTQESAAARDDLILPSLREKLKDETEIQMVSFLIAGQIFLLPVIAIQEVLRHQELIKVPQAPEFVAGVINLRGRVTPLVFLSSLLTNSSEQVYNEKNFIIICGTQQLQIGLIIDRIKSMHLLPQGKIIWNAESKLGDAAEFLCAIADLDDKVCGIVAPENIAQKILSP